MALALWSHIQLPFSNPTEIIGYLSDLKLNPNTILLRISILIFVPAFMVFFSWYFISGDKWKPILIQWFRFPSQEQTSSPTKSFGLNLLIGISLLLWGVNPILRELHAIDVGMSFDAFHWGEQLTPAFNYATTGKSWSASFFIHGGIYDVFNTVWAWSITGYQNIASYLMGSTYLNSLTFLWCTFFLICMYLFLAKFGRYYAATIVITIAAVISKWHFAIFHLDRRELTIFLSLSLFCIFLYNLKRRWLFLSATLAVFGFLYTIERPLYVSLAILAGLSWSIIFPYRLTRREQIWDILTCFAGFATGFFLLFVLIGKVEFLAFCYNTWSIYGIKRLLDSLGYPKPSSIFSVEGRAILLMSFSMLCLLGYFFRSRAQKRENRLFIVFGLTLFLLAYFEYQSAMGRADLGHIMYASFWPYVTAILLLLRFGFSQLDAKKQRFVFLGASAIFFVQLLITYSEIPFAKYKHTAVARAKQMSQPDEIFLATYPANLAKLRNEMADVSCIFTMTNETALSYILKKPSCSRFYVVWFAATRDLQELAIRDLATTKPTKIIFDGKFGAISMDGYHMHKRMPYLTNYLRQNYTFRKSVENYWEIYERKPNT